MTRITATPPTKKFYGSFYDTASAQYAASVNIGVPMSCNTTDEAFGISMNSSSIVIQNSGVYNIQFSTQFLGDHSGDIYIWLKQNGQNVPWSNSKVSVSQQSLSLVTAWNFVQSFNANDVVQLYWATTDTAIHIAATASTVNYPAIPGVILTVTEV